MCQLRLCDGRCLERNTTFERFVCIVKKVNSLTERGPWGIMTLIVPGMLRILILWTLLSIMNRLATLQPQSYNNHVHADRSMEDQLDEIEVEEERDSSYGIEKSSHPFKTYFLGSSENAKFKASDSPAIETEVLRLD